MRTTTKVLAVLVAAASTATLGGLWGSTISARAEAPVRARDAAVVDVAPDPAATRAPLVVAADVLPGGLALPAGVRPLGAPRAGESTSDLHRWETDLELGAVPGADALAALRRDLTADPRISVLVLDAADPYRFVTLVGTASLEDEGADELIAEMSLKYTGEEWVERATGPRVNVVVDVERVIEYGH